jgi:pimeloyl-ACP methyl ester carboxylesterase
MMGVFFLLSFLPQSVQAKGQYAQINGTQIYYEVEGDGHPLILIHGYSLDVRMWDDQMHVFTKKYRVIRYDRRGFGKSSGVEQTYNADAEDLYKLLKHLKIKSCYVLGMSQGGGAALYFALNYPQMVDALVLQDTGVEGFRWPRNPKHTKRKPLREIARTEGLEKAREVWLQYPLFEVSRKKPEVFRKLREIIKDYPGTSLLHSPAPQSESESPHKSKKKQAIDRLKEIQAPTLVILGELESIGMHAVANALTYGISNAEKVVIPKAGHMANMDEPDAFNIALLQFLGKVDRKRSE